MAKYKLRAIETFEVVEPATELIFTHLLTGEEVGDRVPVPERRYTTEKGQLTTARNIKDRDRLLKTGKWELIA